MATNSTISSVLKDVIAYVDVWSSDKTANYSKPFVQQLQEMGAQVTKTFTKQVTHVIFSHGHPATWRRAKKSNVKLVSVLWVSRCYDEAVQVNEDSFPALNETNPVLKNKKHRCMQPKDSPERTPDNDKRIRRKMDKMMKDVTPIEPLVLDVSPIIIDEENGIIYSPAFKRSDYMAQRLKDMKEKHENISLTASQMVETPSELKPSLGNSPTIFSHSYDQSNDDSILSVADTGSAAVSPAKEEGTSLPDIKEHRHEHLRTTQQPWMSPCSQVQSVNAHISPVKCPNFEENEDKEEKKRQKSSRRASRRVSVNRNRTESVKCILTDTPGTSDSKKSGKVSRRSTIKSPSSASKELKALSSENISKKGQEFTKRDKSYTETKTTENVKCTVTTSTAAAATSLSIKTTSPKEHTESKLTPIFSALVQLPTVPCESRKTVPCSTDGDDDVFEDYFSPANFRQKPKKAPSSGQSAKTFQLPFELDSDSKKRKPRKSESAVNETSTGKKKKLEHSTLHLNDLDTEDASEKLSHKDGNKLLSDLASSSDNLKQLTKRRRQSVLPFTSICAAQTTQHKQLSAETTKSEETPSTLDLHKKPDRSLKSSVTLKGNEDPVASGLTQAEEQTEEKGASLQTMVHSTKVGRTLVMTSMPTEKQGTVIQVVKALGGFTLVDEVCESTTHVVSGSHRRTLNILLGIARGCWILSFEWILWSLEKRQWIPEEPYELSDQFPAAQICRLQRHLSAGEHQQDLFQDQPAMFVSQLSRPPPQSLIELIQLCGGTVCRTVRQAGLFIGRYSGRTPEGSRVLSEQWVLDSITHLKVLPYDDYTLD